MSPKVDAATFAPASYPEDADLEWCPPGHGDIYSSLLGSGMLDALIDEGIKYLFVSNSDNLGATLDAAALCIQCSTIHDGGVRAHCCGQEGWAPGTQEGRR